MLIEILVSALDPRHRRRRRPRPAAGDHPLRRRPAPPLRGLRGRPGRPGAAALDAPLRPQPAERTDKPLTLDGTKFTVESTGVFVNNNSGSRLLLHGGQHLGRLRADHLESHLAGDRQSRRLDHAEHRLALDRLARPQPRDARRHGEKRSRRRRSAASASRAAAPEPSAAAPTPPAAPISPTCRPATTRSRPAAPAWSTRTATRPAPNHPVGVTAGGSASLPLEYDQAATMPVAVRVPRGQHLDLQTGEARPGLSLPRQHDTGEGLLVALESARGKHQRNPALPLQHAVHRLGAAPARKTTLVPVPARRAVTLQPR